MNVSHNNYDPNVVIQAAEAKLSAGDVQGGQTLFQSSLFNWVDEAQFGNVPNQDQLREAIATLWISYAQYLQKAKQFKTASEAYEDATKCPVSGRVGRIWLEYARFLEERKKVRSAQQIYLRALVGTDGTGGGMVDDEQDQNLLWSEFLTMMQTKANQPELTLNGLKEAVQKEHTNRLTNTNQEHPDIPGSGGTTGDGMYDDLHTNKRPRLDSHDSNLSGIPDAPSSSTPINRTHVVTAKDVQVEEEALADIVASVRKDPLFVSTWMVMDGDGPPTMPIQLFTAAPPKLSDPSGRDLLGDELALELVSRLVTSGKAVLSVAKGMWMLAGLTEQKTSQKLKALDTNMTNNHKELKARLDERLSVAGAAAGAVQTVNELELANFEQDCRQRREKLLGEIAWEWRQLLWIQQLLLGKLGLSAFQSPTADTQAVDVQSRVCAYLHSAFFLRDRIGKAAHTTMLEKRLVDLKENPRPVSPVPRSRSPIPNVAAPNYPVPMNNAQQPQYPPPFPSHLPPPPPPPPPPPQLPPPPNNFIQQPYNQQQQHMGMPGNFPQQQHQNPPYYR